MDLFSVFEPIYEFSVKHREKEKEWMAHAPFDCIIVFDPFIMFITQCIKVKIYT